MGKGRDESLRVGSKEAKEMGEQPIAEETESRGSGKPREEIVSRRGEGSEAPDTTEKAGENRKLLRTFRSLVTTVSSLVSLGHWFQDQPSLHSPPPGYQSPQMLKSLI